MPPGSLSATPILLSPISSPTLRLTNTPNGKVVFHASTATSIFSTINQLLGNGTEGSGERGNQAGMRSSGAGKGRVVIDETRNSIIYNGTATDWYELLGLIKRLDQAPKQVLIEVTIAEVTLNEQETFGVEWFARGACDESSICCVALLNRPLSRCHSIVLAGGLFVCVILS